MKHKFGQQVCGVVCAALTWSLVWATDVTRYSNDVSDPDGAWTNPPRAEGTPNSNGNDDQYAKTNSDTTTAILWSRSWSSFTLPPNRAITGVWVNVICRYDSGTLGNRVRLRVDGSVDPDSRRSDPWNQSGTGLAWRFGGNGWDITGKRAVWTAANIANLDLGVQRESGSTQLRVDGFRVIVRHEPDADGDGIADALDPCPSDPLNDADGDGRCANSDNCPAAFNPDQADLDGDGIGDACDPCTDPDRDGRCTGADNCPNTFNPWQYDLDRDGLGDECDPDRDGDRILNESDGCPDDRFNDSDGDGVCGNFDNCDFAANPNQADLDQDGIGDACDTCPTLGFAVDLDQDCVLNDLDNCPYTYNPDQIDLDRDNIGDVCDDFVDSDGDGVVDDYDSCPGVYNLGTDFDGDGQDTACDLDEVMIYVPGSGYATGLWSMTLLIDGQPETRSGGSEAQPTGSGLRVDSGGQTGGGWGGAFVSASANLSLSPGRVTGVGSGTFTPGSAIVVQSQAAVESRMTVELSRAVHYRRTGNGLEVYPVPPARLGPALIGPGRYEFVITGGPGAVRSGEITLGGVNPCPSDLNADGYVDDTDFVVFAAAYDRFSCGDPGMPYGCPADFDADGSVDDTDFVYFAQAYAAFDCP